MGMPVIVREVERKQKKRDMSTTTPQPPEDNKPLTAIIGVATLIVAGYLIWQCIKLISL